MLIHSASQLLTLSGGPQRGHDLGRLGLISDGAVLIRDGLIAAVGDTSELRRAYPDEPTLDARGHAVLPGFVDPHTHAIWAGDRAPEFEQRLQGKTYLEILAMGGGILSTVRATRAASIEQMCAETRPRLQSHVRPRHYHRRGQDRLRAGNRRRAAHARCLAPARRRRPARDRPHLPGRPCHRPRVQRRSRWLHPARLHRNAARRPPMVRIVGPCPSWMSFARPARSAWLNPAASSKLLAPWGSRSRSTPMNSTTWAAPAWQRSSGPFPPITW